MLSITIGISLGIWICILLLPWQPWRFREKLNANSSLSHVSIADITVMIPARNEEKILPQTLPTVVSQSTDVTVLLINDKSTDSTAMVARALNAPNLTIVEGSGRKAGWSGKLWALEQGRAFVQTPYIMLLDADIELSPYLIATLKNKLVSESKDFVSIMASPPLYTFWEKLLMPAFIYFFKLLYPFHLSNSSFKWVAAAAGGCVLMKREVLESIGGFEQIKDAIIDDCELAWQVKQAGWKMWVGTSLDVNSKRPYKNVGEIWDMVARTAYTQLKYSPLWLLACTIIMIGVYWLPILGLLSTSSLIITLSMFTYLIMSFTYLPTILYYKLSPLWSFSLPFIAGLYLAMTWTSAIRYWRGEKHRWRGRIIKKDDSEVDISAAKADNSLS